MQKKGFLAFVLGFIMFLSGCAAFPLGGASGDISGNSSTNQSGNPSDGTESDNGSVTIDIYAVNDLHGKFSDTYAQPGVDELSTYIKQSRTENENTIVLSSGDMWQGTAESGLTKGAIVTEWMNEMDFVSMTLGNHEYDWGEEYIESNAQLAEFPFLAINVYDSATNQLVDYCQPSVMVEQNGVKIGIIGAIGDCYSSISGDFTEGFYFKTGNELTELVKAESEKLRAEGADCILYSLHDGYGSSKSSVSNIFDSQLTYYDITLSQGYVDLVFEAHTHQSYVLKDSKGVYHLQGGGDNKGITHAEITVNTKTDSVQVGKVEYVSTSQYSHLDGDLSIQTILEKYADEVTLANKKLGYNDTVRGSSEICQLVAQLYYEKALEVWGADYDIVLGGGFLKLRSPYNLYAGEVIYGDLYNILPFDNQLVLCSISGSKLRDKFFNTNNSNYHIAYGEYGESVKANISPNKTYYVIVDSYTSTYASNGLTEIERFDSNVFARDLLAEYIEKGGLGAGGATEIKITPLSEILQIGNALATGATTTETYYVKGTVQSISSTTYGNLTIKDENGKTLYIYGVYSANGATRYDGMENPPKVGDTIVLAGKIMKYNSSTIEMVSGRLQSIE